MRRKYETRKNQSKEQEEVAALAFILRLAKEKWIADRMVSSSQIQCS